MAAIYDIKSRTPERPRSAVTADLASEGEALARRGAQAIVAGCTEIPLALRQEDLGVPYFDSVLVLARAAVTRAGGEVARSPSPSGPAPGGRHPALLREGPADRETTRLRRKS